MKKRAKKRRGLINSLLAPCLVLLMGGYLIWSLIYNQVQISAKRQELAAVQTQLAAQQADNEELSRQLEESDEEIIEQVARDELGYAKPSERVFVDMSGK